MEDCTKRPFDTEEDARKELQRIIETPYNPVPSRNKKPSRFYLCECSKWHLTSSIDVKKYY